MNKKYYRPLIKFIKKLLFFITISQVLESCNFNDSSKVIIDQADKRHHMPDKMNALLEIQKDNVNYGDIFIGDTVKQRFIGVNLGPDKLNITGFSQSCSCTTTKFTNYENIQPLDSVLIDMLVATKGKPLGKNIANTTIYTNRNRKLYLVQSIFNILDTTARTNLNFRP